MKTTVILLTSVILCACSEKEAAAPAAEPVIKTPTDQEWRLHGKD